jgi:serine/threonine protein kinase
MAAIGAGGMGEVYRATDTKLARDIALKVLPPDMASDPGRLARFQREARAVAALNHPNVVTVYSVEESDGVHFITMELIEGQTLDRLISANGLPVDRIIEIARSIAEALAAAHEKGIVHRDLKPANVMVTSEGRVKVLDFGLAKDIGAEAANDATLISAGRTQGGMVMGTPAYMSPEQVSGRPLDHRSDIFSFGVVLHEMATGRRPFEGSSSAELVSSILRDTPPTVTDARPELPSDIARVIRRCLEKDPRHRVQTARDVSNEFRDLMRTSTRPAPVSTSTAHATVAADSGASRADEGFWVAVLPFKCIGSNAELTALAEGLSEDIVTALSRFSYLRVIARSSSSRYAHELLDVRSTGKALGARYVMEGSLRQAGAKVRIAVQLVDTSSGAHLWAETYDRSFSPETAFELQDDVVSRVVSTVADSHGVLPHSMSEAVRSKGSDQLSPYEALLHSFGYFERVSAEEHTVTRDNLERAVRQAPGHADCWAILTILYVEEHIHGFNARPDPLSRALAAARRAVEAAPSNHLAYHALATVLFYRRELQAFRNAADRAVALNPMDGYTAAYQGFLTAYAGDWARGCELAERARKLNPHHPGWYWFPSVFDGYRKRDYRAALDAALKINMPRFWRAHLALAVTYGQLGEREAARAALRQLLSLKPEFAASAREELGKTWDPELVEHLMDGLRKAGLESAGDEGPATAKPATSPGS